jgi:hypothetical protein
VIYWNFKEWLNYIESFVRDDKLRNFTQIYDEIIKPFLNELINYSKQNPDYFKKDTGGVDYLSAIEQFNSNPEKMFNMLFSDTLGGYDRVVYSDTNFATAFNDKYLNNVKNYLMKNGDYRFKSFNTFEEYLQDSGRIKSVMHGAAPTIITTPEEFMISFFHKPLVNNLRRETSGGKAGQVQLTGQGEDDGGMSLDDFSTGSQVTRRSELGGMAHQMASDLYDCCRELYENIAKKLKKEIEAERVDFYNSDKNASTIKNLNNLKKKLHKFFAAEFVSGQQESKSDYELGDDNVSDEQFSQIMKTESKNMAKGIILDNDKFKAFLNNKKTSNDSLYNFFVDVVGTLYYIALIKNVEKEPSNNSGFSSDKMQQKKKMRQDFMDLLPQEFLNSRFSEERLRDFSSMSGRQFPQITYPANMEEIKNQGFESLMHTLATSHSFPVNYEERQDADGLVERGKGKVDAINKFFEPIFTVLGSKEVLKDLRTYDCDDIMNYFAQKGIIEAQS